MRLDVFFIPSSHLIDNLSIESRLEIISLQSIGGTALSAAVEVRVLSEHCVCR